MKFLEGFIRFYKDSGGSGRRYAKSAGWDGGPGPPQLLPMFKDPQSRATIQTISNDTTSTALNISARRLAEARWRIEAPGARWGALGTPGDHG